MNEVRREYRYHDCRYFNYIEKTRESGGIHLLIHTDKHLNVFIPYGETHTLENNLTKALIHTLSFLDTATQLSLLAEWLGEPRIQQEDISSIKLRFGLQIKPPHFDVTEVPLENRLQLGICPSGEAWNEELLRLGELPTEPQAGIQMVYDQLFRVHPEVIGVINNQRPDELWKIAKEEYEVLIDRHEKGSIPDAWILIEKKGKPNWCIIVENKWYDLNPHQLRNHREKALQHPTAVIKPRSFAFLYDSFSRAQQQIKDNTLIRHFLEYLTLTGHEPAHRFYPSDLEVIREAKSGEERKFYADLLYGKFYQVLATFAEGKYDFDTRTRRMNIAGVEQFNFVFDFDPYEGKFGISSEIGVKSQLVNQRLFPRMLEKGTFANDIQTLYPESKFQRFIRLNYVRSNLYFSVGEYANLSQYLQEIESTAITRNGLSNTECQDKLTALGIDSNHPGFQRLSRSTDLKWHKLEYLRILDYLDINDYINEPNHARLFGDLGYLIDQHLAGIHRFEAEWQLVKPKKRI